MAAALRRRLLAGRTGLPERRRAGLAAAVDYRPPAAVGKGPPAVAGKRPPAAAGKRPPAAAGKRPAPPPPRPEDMPWA